MYFAESCIAIYHKAQLTRTDEAFVFVKPKSGLWSSLTLQFWESKNAQKRFSLKDWSSENPLYALSPDFAVEYFPYF